MELSRSRQILMAVSVSCAYCVWGLLISLQPTFYPSEAERKGATPKQYGFVFGIANLAAFLFAPIFGRWGSVIGPKILYNFGAYLQAICGFAFGFMAYVQGPDLFIGLSYLLRALGGIADVAAWGAVLSILMKLYPTKVSRIMSGTQMFFGLGYMLGPALGAFLFGLGGFTLPFVVVGSVGLVVATALVFVIPNVKPDTEKITAANKLSFREIATSPSIFMPYIDLLVCFFGNGMITSMLEPHLKASGADTNQVGLSYLTFGAIYMLSTPLAGIVVDKVAYPTVISIIGNTLLAAAFVFIGPLPSISVVNPSWKSITVSMAFVAFGYACVMVSTFGRAQWAAIKKGYPKDIETYLLISGMWSTSFYLGNFLGPTLAGFMVDAWGFRRATIVFFSLFIIMIVVDVCELIYNLRRRRSRNNAEYTQLH